MHVYHIKICMQPYISHINGCELFSLLLKKKMLFIDFFLHVEFLSQLRILPSLGNGIVRSRFLRVMSPLSNLQ